MKTGLELFKGTVKKLIDDYGYDYEALERVVDGRRVMDLVRELTMGIKLEKDTNLDYEGIEGIVVSAITCAAVHFDLERERAAIEEQLRHVWDDRVVRMSEVQHMTRANTWVTMRVINDRSRDNAYGLETGTFGARVPRNVQHEINVESPCFKDVIDSVLRYKSREISLLRNVYANGRWIEMRQDTIHITHLQDRYLLKEEDRELEDWRMIGRDYEYGRGRYPTSVNASFGFSPIRLV